MSEGKRKEGLQAQLPYSILDFYTCQLWAWNLSGAPLGTLAPTSDAVLLTFSGFRFPCYGLSIHIVSSAFSLFQIFVKLSALNMVCDWCMLLIMILATFWKKFWSFWIGFYNFSMNSDVLSAGFYFAQVIAHCAARLFFWCLTTPVFKYFEDTLLLTKWIIAEFLFATYVIIL